MQFTFKLNEGNSISTYIEFQILHDYNFPTDDLKYIYLSPSYNHYGKWILTLFAEQGKYYPTWEHKKWLGLDFTVNINNLNQLSLFAGSQVGGLVCANGTCVPQPDFEDGFKIGYRTSF